MTADTAGWVRRLGGYVLRHRRGLVTALSAALLASVGQTAIPLIARQIVDKVIIDRSTPLWPWLVLLIAVAIATFGVSYVRRYRGGQVALAVQYDLRNAMHEHLQAMDLQSLQRMSTGQLVARANSDSTLVQALLNYLPLMSANVMLMVLSLGVMIYLSPLLAVVSVVVLPGLVAVSYRMRRRITPATWDAQQREGELVQIVDEDISGVRVVKAFGQEGRELDRIAAAAGTLYGTRMRTVRLQSRYQPLLEAIPPVRPGRDPRPRRLARAASQDQPGDVSRLLHLRRAVRQSGPSAGRHPHDRSTGPGRDRKDLPAAGLDAGDRRRAGRGPLPRRCAARSRSATSTSATSATVPCSGALTCGSKPGSASRSSAPAAAANRRWPALISRLHDPDEGSVLIDGHDLREVTLRSLRRQVGVAFEDSFLFSDTVRANIAYGRPDAERRARSRPRPGPRRPTTSSPTCRGATTRPSGSEG